MDPAQYVAQHGFTRSTRKPNLYYKRSSNSDCMIFIDILTLSCYAYSGGVKIEAPDWVKRIIFEIKAINDPNQTMLF